MTAHADHAFRRGSVLLLDGGTVTELQRRGVRMMTQAWSGAAALRNTAVLMAIHRDYIDAGADIITANTYATARHLLEFDGMGDVFEVINRGAVTAALEARRDCGRPDVLIAGSMSHRGRITPGTATPVNHVATSADALYASLSEQALLLRDAGCDLILLEMMYDPARMPAVYAAASETGLPIWAGFSARRDAGGPLLGFAPDPVTAFESVVSVLNEWNVGAAGIMHAPSNLISEV